MSMLIVENIESGFTKLRVKNEIHNRWKISKY